VRKLTVDDIVDHRAYERERDDFRAAIIALKKRRRVALGDFVTLVFENTDTMRFQVQEMARAERMLTDDAIAGEVATYNELIPDPGELSATLFVELTDDASLREWLPKLRGIEFGIRFDLGPRDSTASRVVAIPRDEERLTRDDITSTVHYLRFPFDAEQRALLASGPARLVVDHPEYQVWVELTDTQRVELAADFD
jgi:prolyl-tRNA synthetase